MTSMLPPSAARVQEALSRLGVECGVRVMPQSTRTAADAAAAVECTVGQIAKSIVFRAVQSERPVLAVVSGANRVDVEQLARLVGEALVPATPAFVREVTGYAIGGVPPVGFPAPIETWVDEDLMQFDTVWAAAGTPSAVVCVRPADLVRVTGGRHAAIAEAVR